MLTITDSEFLLALDGKLQTYQFNPANDSMPRLAQFSKMYERYRILRMNIAYKSGSSTNTAGNIAFGVLTGTKQATITGQDTIMKLRPNVYVPIWKNASLTVPPSIDSSRYMHCDGLDDTSIAFTLYVNGTAKGGMIQVSYSVQFAYPRPF